VHQLVFQWWKARDWPRLKEVHALRKQLWQTALAEFDARAAAGASYDPTADVRILWAAQYLNRAENRSFRIHPDITARAAFHFDLPLAPCGKDLAAGPL
jgi:hypothetical protein